MLSFEVRLHPVTPEARKIKRVAAALRDGAVLLYPTETAFALGCCLSNKNAINRLREIRRLPDHKPLTFLCDSLSHIAEYAKVSNLAYKTIRRLIPGPFTFVLPATKQVPHFAVDAKRKTTGIRVTRHTLAAALLREHESPIISITAKHPDKEAETADDLVELLAPLVDVVVTSDGGEYEFEGESTVIDMTSDHFHIIRHGAGMKDIERQTPELAAL